MAAALLAAAIAFAKFGPGYHFAKSNIRLSTVALWLPPAVYLGIYGMSLLLNDQAIDAKKTVVFVVPSPYGGGASRDDLYAFIKGIHAGLTDQLNYDVLPQIASIDQFNTYRMTYSQPWKKLPDVLRPLRRGGPGRIEFASIVVEVTDFGAVKLTIDWQTYDLTKESYVKEAAVSTNDIRGPKAENTALLSVLASYEFARDLIGETPAQNEVAAKYYALIRRHGRDLDDHLRATMQETVPDQCRTFGCVDQIVDGYRALLSNEVEELRKKASKATETNIQTAVTAITKASFK